MLVVFGDFEIEMSVIALDQRPSIVWRFKRIPIVLKLIPPAPFRQIHVAPHRPLLKERRNQQVFSDEKFRV